jgi:putative chromate ion transporter
MSVFLNRMVGKRKYLTESDLIELMALCSILPGPTSTQTMVSIGYRMGGPKLALFTMLVWALPVLIAMTVLSFLYQFLSVRSISHDVLRYVGPMAVGFIIVAAVRIGRKVIKDVPTALLMVFGAVTTFFIRAPWVFPVVLLMGGAVSMLINKEKGMWNRVSVRPPWRFLVMFAVLALGGIIVADVTDIHLVGLFEHFYRYGYLVFGGGQVVVPVMYSELVDGSGFMTSREFLTGYGLVQGLPGPMFSFAAYAGGMAARGNTALVQVLGAVVRSETDPCGAYFPHRYQRGCGRTHCNSCSNPHACKRVLDGQPYRDRPRGGNPGVYESSSATHRRRSARRGVSTLSRYNPLNLQEGFNHMPWRTSRNNDLYFPRSILPRRACKMGRSTSVGE